MNGPTRTPWQVIDDREADLDADLVDHTRQYLRNWDGWKYGISPSGAAAAAYYVAVLLEADARLNQQDVADLFGTSEVTIRNHYDSVIDANGGLWDA